MFILFSNDDGSDHSEVYGYVKTKEEAEAILLTNERNKHLLNKYLFDLCELEKIYPKFNFPHFYSHIYPHEYSEWKNKFNEAKAKYDLDKKKFIIDKIGKSPVYYENLKYIELKEFNWGS